MIESNEKDNDSELDDELALLLAKEDAVIEKKDDEPVQSMSSEIGEENLEDLFNLSKDLSFEETSSIDDLFSSTANSLNNDNKSEISKEEFADIMNFNDDFGLNNISFDYDEDSINNDEVSDNTKEENDFFNMDLEEDITDDNEEFDEIDFMDEIFTKKEEKLNEKKLLMNL